MARLLTLMLAALLAACGGNPSRAPVEDRNIRRAPVEERYIPPEAARNEALPEARQPPPPSVQLPPRNYTVVRGDTLYSIAWRYGFEVRALARANGIATPYTIFPGQTVKLTDKAPPVAVTKASAPATAPAASRKAPAASTTSTAVAATKKSTVIKPSPAAAEKPLSSGPIRWRWPTTGKVVRGFSGTVHKGIDIAGKTGDKVVAVADGRVVYAGNGIVGYGKLLIVKHNDIYLSAYGHNNKLLVAEGESVKAGQKIAEKGSTATNSVKLHFEIRREGKPVDPKRLLPGR
jgi:lipoprotein NlpD